MEQAKELTAEYICGNEEWLKIAFHVYEAMGAVRPRVIKQIWQGVEKRVRDKIDCVDGYVEENGCWFWHEETSNFWTYAQVQRGPRGPMRLTVGIYLDDDATLDDVRREEIRQFYDAAFEVQSACGGQTLAAHYVGGDRDLHRWDRDEFLVQAINKRDEVESYLADLLVETYRGVESALKRVTKDVWG